MLTEDELHEIEGDVGIALRMAGLDDDAPPEVDLVCMAITGAGPQLSDMRREEKWTGRRVEVRMSLYGTPRGRQAIAHGLGHAFAEKVLRREVTEEWCDCFGAMLTAPRRATRQAIAALGHRPSVLGPALLIEPAAALLRVGETCGRPVALVRRPGLVIARGEPFPWPPIRKVLSERPAGLHPIRVGDRWGMMVQAA